MGIPLKFCLICRCLALFTILALLCSVIMGEKCTACGKTVYITEKLNILNQVWHRWCFRCQVCNTTLTMKTYQALGGKPYCRAHYPQPGSEGEALPLKLVLASETPTAVLTKKFLILLPKEVMIKEVVMTRVMRREDMKRVAMKKEAMKKEATINCVVQLIESVVISKINPTLLYR